MDAPDGSTARDFRLCLSVAADRVKRVAGDWPVLCLGLSVCGAAPRNCPVLWFDVPGFWPLGTRPSSVSVCPSNEPWRPIHCLGLSVLLGLAWPTRRPLARPLPVPCLDLSVSRRLGTGPPGSMTPPAPGAHTLRTGPIGSQGRAAPVALLSPGGVMCQVPRASDDSPRPGPV